MVKMRNENFSFSFIKLIIILFIIFFILKGISLSFYPQTVNLVQVRVEDKADSTRVIIFAKIPLEVFFNKFGRTLEIRFKSEQPLRFRSEPVHSQIVRSLGWASTKQGNLLAIDCSVSDFYYESSIQRQPFQIEIELRPKSQEEKNSLLENRPLVKGDEKIVTKATEMTNFHKSIGNIENKNDFSLSTHARRMKTIVIDPGHGGLETGAKGPSGTLEKDINLKISLKLKEIIERKLALRVVLTRDQDIDISLENRAAVANNNRADLFISIHANGAFRPKARGSETYFLSLRASDEEARRLAYLENNSPEFERKIEEESQDQIMMILWDMAQAAFLKQSSQLAEFIQLELNKLLGTANRGVKQAPFKVLTGVACPAVLVEVAFISNPEEEARLKDEDFQWGVAQAIFQGILNYLRKLS